jgi:hypothetical protein
MFAIAERAAALFASLARVIGTTTSSPDEYVTTLNASLASSWPISRAAAAVDHHGDRKRRTARGLALRRGDRDGDVLLALGGQDVLGREPRGELEPIVVDRGRAGRPLGGPSGQQQRRDHGGTRGADDKGGTDSVRDVRGHRP